MIKKLKNAYIIIFLFVLYSPIIVLIMNSFNKSLYNLSWGGFTFFWYKKLLHNSDLLEATKNSLILGLSSAFFTTIIASLCAFSFFYYKYFAKKVFFFLIQSMMMFPDIVLGISILIIFSIFKLSLGYTSLLFAHIILALPFATLIIFLDLRSIDKEIIETAKDLGADDLQILYRIILPITISSIVSAYLISFAISLDDVIVSYFVSGTEYTILPLLIYSLSKLGIKPEINAICTLVLTLTTTIVLSSRFLMKKKL